MDLDAFVTQRSELIVRGYPPDIARFRFPIMNLSRFLGKRRADIGEVLPYVAINRPKHFLLLPYAFGCRAWVRR